MPTAAPTAKIRAARIVLIIASLLPLINYALGAMDLPAVTIWDLDQINGLVLAVYTAVTGILAYVRAYMTRPVEADIPVPDTTPGVAG